MPKIRFYNKGQLHSGTIAVSENVATVLKETGEMVFQFTLNSRTDSLFFEKNKNLIIVPGFSDVHIHLREPGFSYKETIATGTLAAASAGYTAVCTMPNLNPAPDSKETLEKQLEIIRRDALIQVLPFGTITKGEKGIELSDMAAISDDVAGFTDDGRGVQDDSVMLDAMRLAKQLDKPIAAHCEVDELVKGGVIHDGVFARSHNLPGISSASEYLAVARDLELVQQIGCRYHVCHISTAETVELIRQAKRSGLPVTCETAPHYLTLCDEELADEGRFKMNPPIRSTKDRDALIEGICDGTIDMIATDHAPHSAEEKSKGLLGSAMGVVGLETAFPILYTVLVKQKNIITLEKLIDLMSIAPDRIFRIKKSSDFAIIDLDTKWSITPENFLSKGRATPFENWAVFSKNILTVKDGREIWRLTEK